MRKKERENATYVESIVFFVIEKMWKSFNSSIKDVNLHNSTIV